MLKPTTRESVSDVLTNQMIQQGLEVQKNVNQRNKLINLLDLDEPN